MSHKVIAEESTRKWDNTLQQNKGQEQEGLLKWLAAQMLGAKQINLQLLVHQKSPRTRIKRENIFFRFTDKYSMINIFEMEIKKKKNNNKLKKICVLNGKWWLKIQDKPVWTHHFTYFLLKHFGSRTGTEVLNYSWAVSINFSHQFIHIRINLRLQVDQRRPSIFKGFFVPSSFTCILWL